MRKPSLAAEAAAAAPPPQELRTFVGIDQDPTAHALAQPRCAAAAPPGAALQFVRRNFREFGAALADAALPPASVDGALFDLGMSSMQARHRAALRSQLALVLPTHRTSLCFAD